MPRKRRENVLFELGVYWLKADPVSGIIFRHWYDGRTQKVRRKSTDTADLGEASLLLADIVAGKTAEAQSPETVFMTDVMTHYRETYADKMPSAAHAKRATAILLEWLTDVQKLPEATVGDFSIAWQHAFIRHCAGALGHATGTVSRNMKVYNAAVRYGASPIVVEKDGEQRIVQLLKSVPPIVYKQADISALIQKPISQPRAWLPTFEQLAAFIDEIGHITAKGEWDEPSENLFRYVIIGLNTWARPTAIMQLSVRKQVGLNSGIVDLNPPGRTQNKKYRPKILLTENLRYWLTRWDQDYPMQAAGEPVKSVKDQFQRHAAAMGMPDFTRYTLRHFMATNIRKVDGVSVSKEDRKEWLGHKAQDTTSWYEHHDPEWLAEVKAGTDKLILRIDSLLKKRTITSRIPPGSSETGRFVPKLVVSK